ncbi:reverse transcriptase domain, reverse transcriptase zinc-binding domain protein [Tanacetum coccineum]
MEALQISIIEACNKVVFKGISLAESKVNVSLLQYADDALFFGKWSRSNAKNLIHILKCFEMGSGLKVNISKSRIIGVDVPLTDVESMAALLGCAHESLPFIYLGLLVGKSVRYCDGWNVVIECFRDKISSWKAKALSIGGRLTLIKFILGSLLVYSFFLFKALQKNLGLLGKWKWRFLTEDKALWNIVIKDFYGADEGFNLDANQIGSGKDQWCCNGVRLMEAFPRLFALETH